MKKVLKTKTVILLLAFFVVFYLLLSLIGISRSGLSLSGASIDDYFKHERNIFYSLNAIIANRPLEIGTNTYFNVFLDLNPLTTSLAVQENTGRILVPYINPALYDTSMMTMGAFLLTEAYYNFASNGVILVTIITATVIVLLENSKTKSVAIMLIYCCVCAESFSIVYYGTSNWASVILLFSLFVFTILFVSKKKPPIMSSSNKDVALFEMKK